MRIKILVRKNLKMSAKKVAAQAVHAALGLAKEAQLESNMSVIVLDASDKKFKEAIEANPCNYVVCDAGYTEVPAGTETCVAFLEEDPRESDYSVTIGKKVAIVESKTNKIVYEQG